MKMVPLQEDHTGSRLLCLVRLNNRAERWFLLDTGATSTCVNTRTAEAISLLPLSELSRIFALGRGAVTAQRGLATEFEIVGTSIRLFKQPIWIVSDSVLNGIDGVLGMDLIQHLGQFSLRWRQMIINNDQTVKRRFLSVPTTLRNRELYLPMRLGYGTSIPFYVGYRLGYLCHHLSKCFACSDYIDAVGLARKSPGADALHWRVREPSNERRNHSPTPLVAFSFSADSRLVSGSFACV